MLGMTETQIQNGIDRKALAALLASARQSKYKNERTEVDGISFASKREANRYAELKLLEKSGEISCLEMQKRFKLRAGGKAIGSYVADFSYINRVEDWIVEDAKGVSTPLYKWKKRHFEAEYGVEIREV
jgi:hypothetical protein